MHDNLEDELKAFEKDLSLLLVRFMKLCDKMQLQTALVPARGKTAGPTAPPAPPPPKPVDLRAYA